MSKLVRDNIPEIIRKSGSKAKYHIVDNPIQRKELLLEKLNEEVQEVNEAKTREELQEELADVYEVMCAICSVHNISVIDMEMTAAKKRIRNGGFEKFVVLDEVEKNS